MCTKVAVEEMSIAEEKRSIPFASFTMVGRWKTRVIVKLPSGWVMEIENNPDAETGSDEIFIFELSFVFLLQENNTCYKRFQNGITFFFLFLFFFYLFSFVLILKEGDVR